MKLVLLISISLILAACSKKGVEHTNIDECGVSAHSIGLMTTYCKLKTGINDDKSKVVLRCLDSEEQKNSHLQECKLRYALKKSICQKMIKLNRMDSGEVTCVKNSDYEERWGKGQL